MFGTHFGIENPTRLPLLFGGKHRQIGMEQERLGIFIDFIDNRTAYAATHRELMLEYSKLIRQGFEDSICRTSDHFLGTGTRDKNCKFVSPHSRDTPCRICIQSQSHCNGLKERIAGRVAERVIDGLEIVEINYQQPRCLTVSQKFPGGVQECSRRQKPSQFVVLRKMFKIRFARVPLGNILNMRADDGFPPVPMKG